jgi:hypothetical protein
MFAFPSSPPYEPSPRGNEQAAKRKSTSTIRKVKPIPRLFPSAEGQGIDYEEGGKEHWTIESIKSFSPSMKDSPHPPPRRKPETIPESKKQLRKGGLGMDRDRPFRSCFSSADINGIRMVHPMELLATGKGYHPSRISLRLS